MTFAALLAAADRAAIAHLGGGLVRYTPSPLSGGEAVDVLGIFDASYVRAMAGQAGAVSVGPGVFLRLSDLPSDPEEDEDATVTIAGVEYLIHEPQKDGQGGVQLLLHAK